MDVITCHVNADFDCLSSMIGVKKLFPNGKLVFPGSQEKPVREFLKTYPQEIEKIKDIDISEVKRLIIVDTRSPDRIGAFKKVAQKKDVHVFVYDHHPSRKSDIKGTVETIEDVGATATIITEIIRGKNILLKPMDATLLCLGIYEETGSLRFPSTRERDLLATAFLLKRGANLNIVSNFIKPDLSRDELSLLNELVTSMSEMVVHGIRIKLGVASRYEYHGDAAHLAHRIMDMDDIDAVILILSMGGKIVLIGRSSTPELNMAELMRHFGGDGHWAAASASLNEIPPDVLKEDIINTLESTVKPHRMVKDIMTSPVITMSYNLSIKEAEDTLTKYEINSLPVIKRGGYIGLISREIVEKALFHGFGKSKVVDFTTTDAPTTTINTPVKKIEGIMIGHNQRFMAVLSDNKPIGAVTRTDLLRNLYEDQLRKTHIAENQKVTKATLSRGVARLLRDRLPTFMFRILEAAGEAADKIEMNAYLVGGTVRDILRGEQNLDIDIVIEGDGIRFAAELSKRLKGRLKTHLRFHTAKIILDFRANDLDNKEILEIRQSALKNKKKSIQIDIATARTEYYEKPASLPKVETSSIKKDLYRRDFTINTLAIKLNKKNFGMLIDFFGAQRDLRDKVIRVLHNLSFIEDPTRAFRAVRFSERFGFKISRHTENLIKSAIRLNLFDKLSGTRLYDELMLTFRETEPVKFIKRLNDYGLLKIIHKDLSFTKELEELLNRVHDIISWYNLLFLKKEINTGMLYLMTILSVLKGDDLEYAFNKLSTPPAIKKTILIGLNKALNVMEKIEPDDPVSIYYSLEQLNTEIILFIMIRCEDRIKQKAISNYLIKLKEIRPELKGNDLKRMGIEPGVIYSEIFRGILEGRLRNELKTRADEKEFVERNYLGTDK